MVSTQWRKLPLPDMLRRTPQSQFLISSITFPLAIPNIRGWVSSSCRPFQGIILGRGAKSYTSSQNNSRISLFKHYKDGLNNYGLCLPRTYHFRLSRRWFIQFQDPRHSRRTFKTIPLSAWVPPRRLLHPMGIRQWRTQQGFGASVKNLL